MNDIDPQQALAQTRAIAQDFLRHCFRGDLDAALPLLAADATWWVLGNPETLKISGTRDRAQIERFLGNVLRGFPQGLDARFDGVTAEGERVAIEVESSATMINGLQYRNRYHFLVRVRDGKVIEVREYLDTQFAYEIQQASLPPRKM